MRLRRLAARSISEVVSLGRFLATPPSGLRVLMYHAIGSSALGDSLGIFSLSPALFGEQMDDLLSSHAGHVVALDPEIKIGSGSNIAISFDDGYLDNLQVAAPILVARGLPFTVFVTANFVRDRRSGFLSPETLRELAAVPGARIGAHGANHLALSECNDESLGEELISSKKYLEDTIGASVETMAYPYGAVNYRVRNATKEAGYRLAVCSYSSVNDKIRDRLLLGRTEILSNDDLRVFRQKLSGSWDWYRFRGRDPACL